MKGIDPVTRRFLDQYPSTPASATSLEELRNGYVVSQALPSARMAAQVDDHTIPVGPTGKVALRIVRPPDRDGFALPAVMYFHGGGWVLGDTVTHDRLVREFANGASAAVVVVDYARSPEARYPVAIEQAWAATHWIAENGGALGIDGSRLAVAGDSAGGNMAAVVALMAKGRKGPRLAQQVLFCPTVDAGFDTESFRQFGRGYWLTEEDTRWFWNQYAPDPATRKQPTASPLLAPVEHLRGLPPALVITAEFDILRDEGEAYAHKLIEAGVAASATRHLGTVHSFMVLNALSETPASRAAIAQAVDALRKVLQ